MYGTVKKEKNVWNSEEREECMEPDVSPNEDITESR